MNFIRPARVHHRPVVVRPTWVPRIVSIIRYLPVDRILRAVWEVIVLRPRQQKHTKNAPPCTTYMNLPLRQPRPILRRRMKLRGNADLENIQQSLLRDGPFGQRAAAGGCGVLLDSRHVVVDLGLEVVGELGDVDVGVEVEAALVAGEKAEGLFCGRDEVGAACDGADGGCGGGCVFGLVVGERGDGGLLVCVGVVVFFDNGLVAGGTAGFVVGGLAGFVTSGLVLFVARPSVLFFGCF